MKSMKEFDNLTGKVLVAAPSVMEESEYNKSLVYIMHHSVDGAIGFALNNEIYNLPAQDIFQEYDINQNIVQKNIDVHIGGPLDVKHGFFLHSNDYNKKVLISDNFNKLCISSNLEIIKDVMNNSGPKNIMLIVGYTGWKKGQLEEEVNNNLWIVSDPDYELIFNDNHENSWSNALNFLGIKKDSFVPHFTNIVS